MRAPRPGDLTFSTPRPARLTHPDREYFPPVGCWQEPPDHTTCLSVFTCPTVSLDLPLDAGASSPARQPYLSNLLLDEAYPSDTAILKPQSDVGESLRDKQPYLFKPPARRGLPVRHSDSETTVGRRREPPGQTNFPFPSCGWQGLPNHAAG